jgi:hypothetical protein
VFDPETVTFLESGCALIVGTVNTDGAPLASRGWGLSVPTDTPSPIRLLLDADDEPTLANLPGAVALTGVDVRVLHSVQLKGRVVAIEPATARDRERAANFCDDFFGAIEETDGTPRWKPDRLVPSDYVAALVDVDEVYDQTPGPGAGATLEEPGVGH